MALVDLGISRQANAFYRIAYGARHERTWPAAHAYVRKQQLCRVVQSQAGLETQSDLSNNLSNKSVKLGSTPAYQVRNCSRATVLSSIALHYKRERSHCCCRGLMLLLSGLLRGLFSKQMTLARDMWQLLFLQRW